MNISQQTRDEIVQLYSQHIPVRKIMSRFGVSRSSIFNFLKLDRMHISQITSMEFEIRRLRQENEILKTSGCCLSAPLTERLSCIEKLSDRYSVHVLCKNFNVLRSTYYHYTLRRPEKTTYQISDELIRPLVKQIFEESKGRYGTRKLKAELESRGYIVSLKRLRRYMKELNLKCKQSQLKYFSSSNRKYMYRRNKSVVRDRQLDEVRKKTPAVTVYEEIRNVPVCSGIIDGEKVFRTFRLREEARKIKQGELRPGDIMQSPPERNTAEEMIGFCQGCDEQVSFFERSSGG